MNTKLLCATAAALSLLSATVTLAGPSDGIHPGVSPAPWLNPIKPAENAENKKTAPYALTGDQNDASKERRHISRDGWKRTVQRVGNRVVRDGYER